MGLTMTTLSNAGFPIQSNIKLCTGEGHIEDGDRPKYPHKVENCKLVFCVLIFTLLNLAQRNHRTQPDTTSHFF